MQIQDSQDFPYFDAPAPDPPQGPPVLSSDDSGRLDDFFQYFDSNNYNFAFGEGLNFSDAWLSDLPPTFMGTATSFGQQQSQLNNLSSNPGMPAPPSLPEAFSYSQPPMMAPSHHHATQQHHRPPTSQSHFDTAAQADVAAVLTALQSGHQNTQPSRNSAVNGTNFLSHPLHSGVENVRPIPRHPMKTQRRRSPVRPNPPVVASDAHFRAMMFGDTSDSGSNTQQQQQQQQQQQHQQQQRISETPDLQWGSDPSFAKPQGFVPPSRKDTHEVLEQKRISYLQCLELNKSAATTRASSPVGNGEHITVDTQRGTLNDHIKEEYVPVSSPTKRRKSKPKEEPGEEDDRLSPIPPKPPAKKRKSKADVNGLPESSTNPKDASGKRRRSAVNGSKAARENLSETQKRENHIKSEQKRRGAIKEGYHDLGQIVPNLSSSGYSKSMMLTMAADWLEELIKGNEELASLES